MNIRVLSTGGTGFIRINLVEQLLDTGYHVVIYATTPFVREAELSFQHRPGSF